MFWLVIVVLVVWFCVCWHGSSSSRRPRKIRLLDARQKSRAKARSRDADRVARMASYRVDSVEPHVTTTTAAASNRGDSGRKAAVLIGINYVGEDYKLDGCINDAHQIKQLIEQQFGYQEFLLMTDETDLKPIGDNMRKSFEWLTRDARPGDSLFVHYSGHGSTAPPSPANVGATVNDTIVPLDWEENGEMVDEELFTLLVKPLHGTGARLTAIFDCCHSGTGLNLAFNYKVDRTDSHIIRMPRDHHQPLASDVVLLSACLDGQTAADESDGNNNYYGALTNALLQTLRAHAYKIAWGPLLVEIQRRIEEQDSEPSQRPQLSSEQDLNMAALFDLVASPTSRFLQPEIPPIPH